MLLSRSQRRARGAYPAGKSSAKRCLGFVAGTVGLLGLLVLTTLSAIVAPAPATAGAVGRQAASVVPADSSSEESACSPAQQYYSRETETDCGAVASGPGALTAGSCAGYMTAVGYYCTPAFRISLDVAVEGNCPPNLYRPNPNDPRCTGWPSLGALATSLTGKPVSYNAATLISGGWCGNRALGTCPTDESAPLRLVLPVNLGFGTDVKQFHFDIDLSGQDEGQAPNAVYSAWVKILVTVGPSSEDPLSASVTVSNANGAPVTAQQAVVGMTIVATVTLSVSVQATGPVTGVRAAPPVLLTPGTVLSPLGGPSPPVPAGGFTIAPGQAKTYKQKFKLVGVGTVQLSVKAKGRAANGDAVSAHDSITARLGQPLTITVNWLKDNKALSTVVNDKPVADTLRLADGDKTEVPDDVTAQVVVKNTSKVAQDNVAFNGVPPFSFATKAQAVRALPVAVTAVDDIAPSTSKQAAEALKIGSLAPGQSAKVTFAVHVVNNGSFRFSPQVLSVSRGARATNISEGASTLTVLPTALLWLSLHSLDTGAVSPGTTVLIGGTLTNRSLTQSLDVVALVPTIEGNAGDGALVDQATEPDADGTVLPFAGEVAPGETIELMGEVGTSLVEGTDAKLTYAPDGTVIGPDGTEHALSPSEIAMTAGSSPIEVDVDHTPPPPPPSTLETIGDNFVDNAFFYTAKYSYLSFAGAATMVQHPINTIEKTAEGLSTVAVAVGSTVADVAEMEAAVLLLATVGQAFSPEQREAFATEVVADVAASKAVKMTTAVATAVTKAAYDAFVPFADAIHTGNYNQVAALAGQGFGAGLTSVGDFVVSDVIFQKFLVGLGQVPSIVRSVPNAASELATATAEALTKVKSAIKSPFANDITLAQALRDSKIAQSLGKGLRGIEAGQDLLLDGAAALTDIYGLTISQVKALQAFCEANEFVIAVRSRSKRAAQLIRDGLAVGKNEIIKIKAVNEIDVQYLGYSSADADLNTIVWAEPVPIEYVFDRLAASGADELTRDIVLQRYYLRESEWVNPKITKVITSADKSGTISWTLDGSGNGASTLIEQTRGFGLKPQPNPVSTTKWPSMKDRTYQQVLVSNKPLVNGKVLAGSRLVPITQDVDMMAVLTASGQILDAVQRSKVYEYLSDLIGIEHGETPSWILNGEIIFQAKAKILADAIPGGEALAVFGPDGSVTAGFYNAALTTFNNLNKTGNIFFEGGYNNPYYLWKAKLQTSLGNFANGL
jgi:hypothetical protein